MSVVRRSVWDLSDMNLLENKIKQVHKCQSEYEGVLGENNDGR